MVAAAEGYHVLKEPDVIAITNVVECQIHVTRHLDLVNVVALFRVEMEIHVRRT